MIYMDLILNLALLIALTIVSGFLDLRWPRRTRAGVLMQGVLFGSAAVFGMLKPLNFGPGLIFDGRSVMLSLCALFFGPLAAIFAALPVAVFRLMMGGSGVVMGVLVVLSSTGIGLIAHAWLQPDQVPPKARHLYLFGLAVHLAMVALMATLPREIAAGVMLRIGPPVLLLYPLATVLAGKILSDQVATQKAMAGLMESEERLRKLSDNLPGGMVYQIDTGSSKQERRFTYVSAGVRSLHEISPQDAIADASLIYRQLSEESRKLVSDNEAAALAEMKPFHAEVLMNLPSGKQRWRMLTSGPRRLPSQHLVWDGVEVDITERRQAEEDLIRFRFMVDHARQEAFLVEPDGQVVYVNRAAAQSLGYTVEEMLKMRVSDFDPLFGPAFHQHFEDLNTPHQSPPFETVHVAKDGRKIPKEMLSSRFQIGGHDYVCAFGQDLTDRKKAEEERSKLQEQLQHAQKMDSIGRLAGGVAHDFNNMLQTIMGNVEMALDQVVPDHPIHGELVEIYKATERSTNLIRQLLAFARKQTVEPKVLDLNETIEGMLKMLRRLIGENIELVWTPASDLWPFKIDPSQIDQILANLCVNARDAITGAGKVAISTANITLTPADCENQPGYVPGQYIQLVLRDNGCGMDAETRSRLFEPFFTTKEMGKGTGLGLATVYGIVRQNNGFINVQSRPGEGTTFTIFLPRYTGEKEHPPVQPAQGQAPAQGASTTVLLVEDDPAILALVKNILETQGHKVLSAGTPGEILELARRQTEEISLLITDVIMPGMNGLELAVKLQEIRPTLRCLFTSGYTADVIAPHGVLERGMHFLQKPFTTNDLVRKVQEVLAQPGVSGISTT